MKKKSGFTLVELLAVIVILAIILVIAVPSIMNTIKDARQGSFESTAKLIASNAETYWLTKQTLGETTVTAPACSAVATLTDDYDTCTITYTVVDSKQTGEAKVSLTGKTSKKFDGCTVSNATKETASATGCK